MEWYWWVLIIIAVAAVGYLKITVFNRWMENKKKKKQETINDSWD